ncbi:GNAT family N-acetyltransferase [Pyxidicoccus fallax]|uniref:GNAT family N-acetyltransferase n=1 Tax=Pyxidicoccus fallax TaxID=394095 RepID=A0A848LY95_9BACT|nr:GNAT family N-acetyltransferase [Pyxidicoccus fallax]NMO22333.1 GNAT family N-acetyltransferase [Pyxidicoccus fallax]NPC84027.1 GNAT family N-acetyltransferase [Pyxidicoccus fallax]
MYEARSLAWRTDLMLRSVRSTVTELGDCVRLETPSDPDFYSGNLLLFPAAPGPGDDERWVRRFREAFAHEPRLQHVMLGWDDPRGERGVVEPFLAKGYTLDEHTVLTARDVQPPPRPLAELDVRPLTSDADWAAATQLHLADEHPPGVPTALYDAFIHRQMARHREVVDAGRGAWFGAFLEGRMVGDLGIFVEDGLGRFQDVGTHPEFRNRGVCGTLVHAASRHAFTRMGARVLVIVAVEDGPAERIYRSVGFQKTERQCMLTLRPGSPAKAT